MGGGVVEKVATDGVVTLAFIAEAAVTVGEIAAADFVCAGAAVVAPIVAVAEDLFSPTFTATALLLFFAFLARFRATAGAVTATDFVSAAVGIVAVAAVGLAALACLAEVMGTVEEVATTRLVLAGATAAVAAVAAAVVVERVLSVTEIGTAPAPAFALLARFRAAGFVCAAVVVAAVATVVGADLLSVTAVADTDTAAVGFAFLALLPLISLR